MKRALFTAAALTIALAPSVSWADAVSPPPVECPDGSIAKSDHCGEWCQASECTHDASCVRPRRKGAPELSCREAGLCVEHDDYASCSGWSMGEPKTRIIARNPCKTDADCIRPARCETALRCMAARGPAAPTAPSTTAPSTTAPSTTAPATEGTSQERCACSLPGVPVDALPEGWLLLGLAAACRRRRRVTRWSRLSS